MERLNPSPRSAFTLIELLVVIAIVSILAAILFPVFAKARESAQRATCLSNLRQVGVAFQLYLADWDDRMPDRRDLKSSLPGGYHPWSGWPPSDPRAGWAVELFDPYIRSSGLWSCPSLVASRFGNVVQVRQESSSVVPAQTTRYWLWRFDRFDEPVPLDNFWGKTPDLAVEQLRLANNPTVGIPEGHSDTELAVDPYFPRTIPSVPAALKGLSVHGGGRNRLFLDLHAKFLKDRRLSP